MPASLPVANTLLAAAIKTAGCTHAGLARRVNDLGDRRGEFLRYDKTAVSHWLSGTQPRPAVRYLIAEVIGQKLGRAVNLTELGFDEPESPDCMSKALIFDRHAGSAIETVTGLGAMDLDRRSLIKIVPFVGAALAPRQRDWLLSLLERDSESTPAGEERPGPVASARAMIRLFDEMDNRFGGGRARVSALDYLTGELIPLLRRPHQESEMRVLFTIAAKLAAMIGWMTYDVGGFGLSQRYMTQALRLCSEGGDNVLAGQILAGMSHLATNIGDPREGLALARAGIATAQRSGSPLGLMRLHVMHARAHALLGDAQATTTAITQAERALDASRGAGSESEWVPYLDGAYLAIEMACCFRDLEDFDNAERFATSAAIGASGLGRRHAISLSVLATARLQRRVRDLDGAVSTARQALHQLGSVSSQRSIQALTDFRRRVAPYRKEPTAQAFEAEARALLGAA